MANRRTRKQKVLASTRRTPLTLQTNGGTHFTIKTEIDTPRAETAVLSAPSHSYVIGDIKKTVLITSAIIACDLFIYILLKLKVINIPGIGF